MKKEKILILTLGTGQLKPNGEAGYIETQYLFEGEPYRRNGAAVKSNFVAEPLISAFEPDEIFILGTVKSLWHQLYATLTTQNNDDLSYMDNPQYKHLFEIEYENGIKTGSDELRKFQEDISNIFSEIKNWTKYSDTYADHSPGVHVLLTKYGINSEELQENYEILKSMEKFLHPEVSYEVAFDITHSFRSLPIYNLVILNYIRNISKFRLDITHIYYGNIDASRELQSAPIVDLGDLEKVLKLTSAVAEFKDTGNASLLLEMLPNSDPLRKTLGTFDFATQLNAFTDIKNALQKLVVLTGEQTDRARYTGIREMIQIVLNQKFFNAEKGTVRDLNSLSDTDLKFMLTEWYFKQNRIGLGLATGLEALRDVNTQAFLLAHPELDQDITDEDARKNAESYFINIAQRMQNDGTRTERQPELSIMRLGCSLREYKTIRNIFAHSLSNKAPFPEEETRESVETFQKDLHEIKHQFDSDRQSYVKWFEKRTTPKHNGSDASKCRVMIDFTMEPADYTKYTSSGKGKHHYAVFYPDEVVLRKLYCVTLKETREKAYFLDRYLQNNADVLEEFDETAICLFGLETSEQEMIYRIFLENLSFDGTNIMIFHRAEDGSLAACKKAGLPVDLSEEAGLFAEKNAQYMMALDTPLNIWNR